jgi:hypothetical protein
MPRIPLYNRIGTPSEEIRAQSVGPRASIDAFAAPSKSVVQLGQSIGAAGQRYSQQMNQFEAKKAQIEFDFAMAEKEAETDRVYRETAMDYTRQSADFRSTNEDTSVDGFRKGHDELNDRFVQNIDTRNDLTQDQKRDIKGRLMPTFIAESNRGAGEAFDRGQTVRSQVAKQNIFSMIGQARQYHEGHPERKRLVIDIEADILKAERDGLTTGFSVQSVRTAFETGDIDNRILAATTDEELDRVVKDINSSRILGPNSQATLRNRVNARRNQLSGEAYQEIVGSLQALDVQFEDQDEMIAAAKAGEVYTNVSTDGEQVVIDFGRVKPDVRQGFIDTTIPRLFKDIDDNVGQAMISEVISKVKSGNSVLDTITDVASYYGDEFLSKTRKDKDDVDAVVVEIAQQMQQEAARQVDSGNFDEAEVNRLLDSSEAVLLQTISGNTPFIERGDAIGTTASTIAGNVAKMRGAMLKAKGDNQEFEIAMGLAMSSNLAPSQSDFKPKTLKKVADKIVFDNLEDLDNALRLLGQNNLKSERFAGTMSAAIQFLDDPNLDLRNPPDQVTLGLAIFQRMKLNETLLDLHLTDSEQRFFNTLDFLDDIHGTTGALQIMRQQRSDTNVSARYDLVRDQIETMAQEVVDQPWYIDIVNVLPFVEIEPEQDQPVNLGYVQDTVSRLTKEYIKLGMDAEPALTKAAEDFAKTHTVVGNNYVLNVREMPENISQMSDLAVQFFLDQNPNMSQLFDEQDIDSSQLGIVNITGSVDLWYLTRDGGYLVVDDDGNYVTFTLGQLNAFAKSAEEKALEETNQNIRESSEKINRLDEPDTGLEIAAAAAAVM